MKTKVTGSWCPECGPNVTVDEDALCSGCGSTCTGPGADRALEAERRLAQLRKLLCPERPTNFSSPWKHAVWRLTAPRKVTR